jgi:hypothetical protein
MEQQDARPTALESESHVTQKRPYAPPQATFVPLKLEERLLVCGKAPGDFSCLVATGNLVTTLSAFAS